MANDESGNREKSSAQQYVEVRTEGGQMVTIKASVDDIEGIKTALAKATYIELPVTGRVNVEHGGYGRYTRYDIIQHEYDGSGPGYVEVLEIRNPPEGKHGIVVHYYTCHVGSDFFEFDTVENALAAWKYCWGERDYRDFFSTQAGYMRSVRCGDILTPWFYAVGNQLIEGDHVFLDVIQDDPEFRFGERYIVWYDYPEKVAVKKCIGVRIVSEQKSFPEDRYANYRYVYWDDGTFWKEDGSGQRPKLMQESELWIQAAIDSFREFLAGGLSEFVIHFLSGSKFIGKWKSGDKKSHHAEGEYQVKVLFEEGKPGEGTLSFKPTSEAPTLKAYLDSLAAAKNRRIKQYEVFKITKASQGKKWAGVYSEPKKCDE